MPDYRFKLETSDNYDPKNDGVYVSEQVEEKKITRNSLKQYGKRWDRANPCHKKNLLFPRVVTLLSKLSAWLFYLKPMIQVTIESTAKK